VVRYLVKLKSYKGRRSRKARRGARWHKVLSLWTFDFDWRVKVSCSLSETRLHMFANTCWLNFKFINGKPNFSKWSERSH